MPITTLYDKVVAGFNQATDRLKATPESLRVLNIAPTIHADHNTVAEVEIDLYPELEDLQPLPVGATQRYVKRQLTYTRAHITTALQSLLGVPNGAYFFDSELLTTVNKAALVNYFNEIGLGLSADEFELRHAGEQYGLVTDKSINFYGSVWFTTVGKPQTEPTDPEEGSGEEVNPFALSAHAPATLVMYTDDELTQATPEELSGIVYSRVVDHDQRLITMTISGELSDEQNKWIFPIILGDAAYHERLVELAAAESTDIVLRMQGEGLTAEQTLQVAVINVDGSIAMGGVPRYYPETTDLQIELSLDNFTTPSTSYTFHIVNTAIVRKPVLTGGELTAVASTQGYVGQEIFVNFQAQPFMAEVLDPQWSISPNPEKFSFVPGVEDTTTAILITVLEAFTEETEVTVTLTIGSEHIFERIITVLP